jgi:uncharacterized phage protein (TIGR01671 family)
MREIKFRCWDSRRNLMISNIHKTSNFNFVVMGKNNNSGYSHLTLMQFTGLTDKNGKEIYEGDRIKGQSTGVCEVIFDKGCFAGQLKEQELPSMILPLYIITNYCEVIGNIYEGK